MFITLHGTVLSTVARPAQPGGASPSGARSELLQRGSAVGLLSALTAQRRAATLAAGQRGCTLGVVPPEALVRVLARHKESILARVGAPLNPRPDPPRARWRASTPRQRPRAR